MGFQTDCTWTGEDRELFQGSVSPPIYEASLFTFPSVEEFDRAALAPVLDGSGRPFYTRGTNPTVQALERKIALLERGEAARAFGSGMAAIVASVLSCAQSGDHVLAVRSIYSAAYVLLSSYLPRLGIATTFADFTDVAAVDAAIRPDTRVLYFESPGNPGMHLVDIPAVVDLARSRGLATIIDNSMATPYNQRPLEMGVDLVLHSASKYFSGHSDVVAGVVAGSMERMSAMTAAEVHNLGGIIGPFESWLILRGLRTLGLRMKAHNEAAQIVAEWLEPRPEVQRVNYAGLGSHPQHDLARRQMCGYSGLLSFVIEGGLERAIRFVDGLTMFGIGVSWGGFESLALPYRPPKGAPPELTTDLGIVPGLVRISVGLEDVNDLLCDLERALEGAYDD